MHYQPKQDLLNDCIILVTGASDGIGREAAMTYARYGATVILLGRNEEKLRQVASHINEETGRQPQWFILDLLTCTSEDCQQLAQRITVNYPRLDGVLHNAGLLGDVCPMSEQNPQVWQDVIQVNVNATFMLTQALLPLLLKSDAGSLVFTSSSVGRQGRANWGAYAASKFATEGMMQVLADEYQQRLRVNCINPGGTRTAMRASAFPTEDPQKLKTPADIMPLYLWLMGDDSRRKTGMTFDAQPGRKRNFPMSDERYQQRQQRVKEKVDARVAQARMNAVLSSSLPAMEKAKPPRHLVRQHAQLVTEKKWASCSLLKAPGLMANAICWSHMALSFR